MIRPWAAVGGGLLALGLVAGAAQLSEPAPLVPVANGRPATAPVVGATLVCPDLHTVPGVQSSRLVAADADPGPGQVTVAAVGGSAVGGSAVGGRAPAVLLATGDRAAAYHGPLSGPLLLRATGPLAGGLVAEQLNGASRTDRRGWSDVACSAPRAHQWFVGPGTVVGESPVVQLANPSSVPALVSISVLTPTGPAATAQGQSIAIAADSVLRVPLAQLAPNAAVTAVEVSTVTGRVAAAVHDVRTNGLVPLGNDWVPGQAGPALRQQLPGLPARAAGQPVTRTLVVADPGSQDAVVTVRVSTPQGTFVPTGFAAVPVAPGTVRMLSLDPALAASAGAVTLLASTPVVAGALLDVGSSSGPDHEIAYLAPAQPLTGAAAVPQNPIGPTVDSVLELSAPAAAGVVTVTGVAARGGSLSVPVTVPAGQSVEVSLRSAGAAGGTIFITPRPGSGPVLGDRIIEQNAPDGPLLAAMALPATAPRVPVPEVAPAPLSLP